MRIPKGLLRARGLYDHVWDARNGLLVTERAHAEHHSGKRPIPRDVLPPDAWELAAECGPWATRCLERHYPAQSLSCRRRMEAHRHARTSLDRP